MKQKFNNLRTRLLAAWFVLTSRNYIGIGWNANGMAEVAHNNTTRLLYHNLYTLADMNRYSYELEQMDSLVTQAQELVRH